MSVCLGYPPPTPEQMEKNRISQKKRNLKYQKYKYLCIGNDKVRAEWLPRWYKIPFEECLCKKSIHFNTNVPASIIDKLLILKPRLDKNYDIKIAKTEHLLNGGNDGI